MRSAQSAEVVVGLSVGEVVTELVMRFGLGADPSNIVAAADDGLVRVTVPGGRATVLVRPEGRGSRLRWEGEPPPWPLSRGWAQRRLGRLTRRWPRPVPAQPEAAGALAETVEPDR